MVVGWFMNVAGALTGIRSQDEILQHHVIHHTKLKGGMFQHDNARLHVACFSQGFLWRHNIQTLPWPTNLPHLNPKELL